MSDPRTPMRRLFNRSLSTFLLGVDAPTWWRLLRENRFALDVEFGPRALLVSLASVYNSFHRAREARLYGPSVARVAIQSPLFVLGHWRSGTAHLYRLLASDDRFSFPNFYQALFPHTFLSTERFHTRLTSFLLPRTRPYDGVPVGYHEPAEDELALAILTGYAARIGEAFPRRRRHYERYLTFRNVPQDQLTTWKSQFEWYLKKLTWKTGQPLILKSPAHTGHIALLLEMFPEARFVHIRRNPYAVFQSSYRQLSINADYHRLQRLRREDLVDLVLRRYVQVYESFFEERPLIPDGRFSEVSFEELEADPVGTVKGIYEGLDLGEFASVEAKVRGYLATIAEYRTYPHPPLPPLVAERVASTWRRSFAEWGYPT